MADISAQINAINAARYGEEVRGSIVTALTAVNDQVEADETSAGASATAAAESAAEAAATEERLASAVAAAEATESDIEAAEALRVTAEEGRVSAEEARAAAEAERADAASNYVAQANAAATRAQQYAESDYALNAQSWAIGGTSSRYGEDTNNSKYWAEVAAQVVTEGGVSSFNGRTGLVQPEAGDYDTTMISRGTGSAETSLASIESQIGNTAMGTTATTLTGAIAELVNQSLRRCGIVPTNTNLDNFFNSGFYCLTSANTYSGLPTGVSLGMLLVLKPQANSNTYTVQILVGYTANVYVRLYQTSSWTSWKQVQYA